uniref:Putative transforming growth factor-beta-induced protein ig-h3-like isoform x1 n=1 Tax=Lutzomyia longipalpis TaxID=7200 RepID=A0A7G3B1I8_LUTLO
MERFPSISLLLLVTFVAFVATEEFDQWHSGLLDFSGTQGLFWPHQLDSEFRDGSNFGVRQPAVEHIPMKPEESLGEKPDRDTEPLARAASPGFADGFSQWHSGLLDFSGTQGLFWPHQLDSEFRDGSNFGVRQPAVEHIPMKPEESLGEKPDRDTEPLDVEFISGSIGNPDDTQVQIDNQPQRPVQPYPSFGPGFDDTLFQHTFTNFPGFNSFFPGFGFNRPQLRPWWRGPNVCTEKEEDIEEWDREMLSGLSLNFESCVEKTNKHVCKTISNRNGQKYTVTVTHKCCHGYERTRDGARGITCKKVDLHSVEETAESLGAKEFMRSVKNNGLTERITENITIFVPLDSAFTLFSEKMFESNLVVLPLSRSRRAAKDVSGITTRELALAHIVDGFVRVEDIQNEQLLTTSFENSTIRMNIFPRPPNQESHDFRYTANCAPLKKVNKVATNGIVHVVEKVLAPVTQNILEIIEQRSDMTILRTVLQKTEIDKLLMQDGKSFTLFAPTDRAFEKLEPHLRRTIKEGSGCAANILKNHVLDLTFCSCAVVNTVMTHTYNLLDQKMTFERLDGEKEEKETPEASEVADMTSTKEITVNGLAKITEADIMATNGVIHVIDTVIPTESGMPITSMLSTQNLTTFKRLLEVSGREEEFEMMSNVSFFVPSDRAFKDSRWAKELEENPEGLKDNEELITFLNYHVGIPLIKTCDLTDDMIHTKSGSDIRVNLYATHPVFSNVMNRATVNCARLIHFDDESCGSVLHQVDKVLEPPTKSLLEILDSTEKYSKWLDFIRAANLTSLLEDTEQDFTLMVPTNDVFREQREWYEEKLKKPEEAEMIVKNHMLQDILKNHVLDLTFCSCAVVNTVMTHTYNLLDQKMTFERLDGEKEEKETPEASEVADMTSTREITVNGLAKITEADIMATNGVIHVIDTVIPTESGMPITSMLSSQNLTTFKRLLEASGREEEFEMMSNVSFFVPSDRAFKDSRWAKELEENPEGLKDNEELITFLNYHVGIPLIKTCDLTDDMIHTKSGSDIRVNLYATHPVFSNVMNRATVNCARLIHFDDESCGSVLHQVDKVLEPPTKSLLEILDSTEKYSKWLDFIRAANLTSLLEDTEQDFTLMVPTNDVFREQREWYEEKLKKPEEAEMIVKNHMLQGIVPSDWPFVRTIEALSGRPLRIDRGRRPVVANAGITKCDVVAKNGVLHEINDVIIPKERQRTPVSSFFW